MPSYQVFARKGSLSDKQKEKLASAITEGHCKVTGAPDYYVQVIIQEVPEENRYICGKKAGDVIWIRGDVRCRTPEENRKLMETLMTGAAEACGCDPDWVWCDLCGIQATDILKFGTVFPPAGQEKAWQEALPERVKEKIRCLREGSGD